mmetsp:Transcript_29623/g.94831  ORF Transcript_29623/g.94831 Transcript_29623/m.94831 type:complete len:201 (+) Transcript_29623:305-907(+)
MLPHARDNILQPLPAHGREGRTVVEALGHCTILQGHTNLVEVFARRALGGSDVPHYERGAEDVSLLVVVPLPLAQDLRSHVPHRPCVPLVVLRVALRPLHLLAHAEVCELQRLQVLGEHEVGWLQVSVDDDGVAVVQKVKRTEEIEAPAEDGGLGKPRAVPAGDVSLQRRAIHELLEDDGAVGVDDACSPETHDVGVGLD